MCPVLNQADFEDNMNTYNVFMAGRLFLYSGTGPDTGALHVWDTDTRGPPGQLMGHDAEVKHVAAKGNLAASVQTGSYGFRLWNLETLQCTANVADELEADGGDYMGIASLCCTEDKVLLGCEDGPIKLWDVAASSPCALPDLLGGHADGVNDMKISASANTLLSGSNDQSVLLWDLRTGKCVRNMEGHSQSVLSVDMDGPCRTAVSGSVDKTVKLWDLGSGRCIAIYENHASMVRDVVMHESGSSFLSMGNDFFVNAWVVSSDRPVVMQANMTSMRPGSDCCRMFASRDLATVACSSADYERNKLRLNVWR